MSQSDHYDILALGSGEAGKLVTWHFSATQKKRCAVIERIGLGACPTVACLPSKNLLYSAKAVHQARNLEQFGLPSQSDHVDYKIVKQRKDTMVKDITGGLFQSAYDQSGVELIWGQGRFVGEKKIEVDLNDGGKRTVTADVVLVNTGSTGAIPDTPGLREAKPLTHVEFLNLAELPRHLVILGGGYVGLEFAQASVRLGAKVTVIQRGERILKNEDPDVVQVLQDILASEGVVFQTSTTIDQVQGLSGDQVTLQLSTPAGKSELTASHILCATGRTPNTSGIGLDLAGIQLTPAGNIQIDDNNRTTAPDVFAGGDCVGSPYFTHIGWDDYRIIRDAMSAKPVGATARHRSDRQLPSTLFTDPEIAQVGLREHEARAKGIEYRLAKLPMVMFVRTATMEKGAAQGFAKALLSAKDDTILGFTAIGPHAGEMLPVVQLAMLKGLPYTDIGELIVAHPTMNEGLVMMFDNVPK